MVSWLLAACTHLADWFVLGERINSSIHSQIDRHPKKSYAQPPTFLSYAAQCHKPRKLEPTPGIEWKEDFLLRLFQPHIVWNEGPSSIRTVLAPFLSRVDDGFPLHDLHITRQSGHQLAHRLILQLHDHLTQVILASKNEFQSFDTLAT